MKTTHVGVIVIAVCLCWGPWAMAQANALGSDGQGKRYMGSAKQALADFHGNQRERGAEGSFECPLEAEETLTERTFPEFHAQWLQRLFVHR